MAIAKRDSPSQTLFSKISSNFLYVEFKMLEIVAPYGEMRWKDEILRAMMLSKSWSRDAGSGNDGMSREEMPGSPYCLFN